MFWLPVLFIVFILGASTFIAFILGVSTCHMVCLFKIWSCENMVMFLFVGMFFFMVGVAVTDLDDDFMIVFFGVILFVVVVFVVMFMWDCISFMRLL